jgi:hypothetical protein
MVNGIIANQGGIYGHGFNLYFYPGNPAAEEFPEIAG